jgi:hypothetical protein
MRYDFNSEAMSFVNRCLDTLSKVEFIGDGREVKTKEETERFNEEMGWFPTAYGYKNIPLVAAMWVAADLGMDWGGESDGIYEEDGDYPEVAKEWNAQLGYNKETLRFDPKPENKTLDDAIADAAGIAIELENKLYLACVVANALKALEGSVVNVWEKLAFINDEFANERHAARQKGIVILRESKEQTGN